ncbi:hypothetical protein [Albimonas pacifica]|uniref:Uncharacterized protein n=1 Tax=Albimonas pacifica TaxID=1114924 RepID=A0A1I3GTN0_9RHOB|nr:hypothetical protein [Albimonas pacifica]SFI26794.1 hypothetical protein SAMN05216258_105334 [Albimonas pacifica]
MFRSARMASALLLALALVACTAPAPTPTPTPLTTAERNVLGQLLLAPNSTGAMMRVMREEYPAEAEALTRDMIAIERSDRTDAEKRAVAAELGREYRLRHADGLLQANDESLRAYLTSQQAVIEALADDPATCRRYLFGGFGALTPEAKERVDPLYAETLRAQTSAMAQGERAPVGRRMEEDAGVAAAAKAIFADFSTAEMAALKNEGSDAQVCAAFRRFTVRLLEDERPGADSLRALTAWNAAQS